MTVTATRNNFIKGFAFETGLNLVEAAEQWARFSWPLSYDDLCAVESGGFREGQAQGGAWKRRLHAAMRKAARRTVSVTISEIKGGISHDQSEEVGG